MPTAPATPPGSARRPAWRSTRVGRSTWPTPATTSSVASRRTGTSRRWPETESPAQATALPRPRASTDRSAWPWSRAAASSWPTRITIASGRIDPDGTVKHARDPTRASIRRPASPSIPPATFMLPTQETALIRVIDRSGFVTNATLALRRALPSDWHCRGLGGRDLRHRRARTDRGNQGRRLGAHRGGIGARLPRRRGGDALFRNPTGIAWVSPGRLIVADAGNALVRLVTASIPTRAPPARFAADRAAIRCRPVRLATASLAGRAV